ncbi:MAG: TetR/AcrR family transcriptional regulator [Bacillota bacterium]|jgi:AcrR family transcriptional regulator
MADKDMRQRIKEVAVGYFDNSGYHGTTIRSIAKDVECSLPMIYYYYKNKKELFDEIIKKDFFDLLKRQAALLKRTNGIIDFYTKFVYDLNFLSDYDKRVYRLGIKVYLSFDGDEELMRIMDDWEKTILPRHHQMLKPYLKNAGNDIATARTLVHVLETLIQSIVVKNRLLPEEEIREEISIVLREC